MIIDDISDLITNQIEIMGPKKTSKIFGRKRNWAYSMKAGCNFVLNWQFVCGLNELGYELKLVKTKGK